MLGRVALWGAVGLTSGLVAAGGLGLARHLPSFVPQLATGPHPEDGLPEPAALVPAAVTWSSSPPGPAARDGPLRFIALGGGYSPNSNMAVVERLGAALGLSDEPAARFRRTALRKEIDALEDQVTNADAQVDEDTDVVRAALLQRWPMLDDPLHPDFDVYWPLATFSHKVSSGGYWPVPRIMMRVLPLLPITCLKPPKSARNTWLPSGESLGLPPCSKIRSSS
jgi:hypothetical protein